ncbi:MAG: hypothetical protein IPL78_21155 [Chloroflexi bacterium]|nr:hypothetical protein [Chloroflexota bacterium]
MITTASQRLSSKDLETIKDVISKAKPFFPSDLLVHDPTCKLDQLTAKEDFLQAMHNANAFMMAVIFMNNIIDEVIEHRAKKG